VLRDIVVFSQLIYKIIGLCISKTYKEINTTFLFKTDPVNDFAIFKFQLRMALYRFVHGVGFFQDIKAKNTK
jgi:hypothetical protein